MMMMMMMMMIYCRGSHQSDEELYLPPSANGRVWFSLVYDGAVEQLNVTLIKAKELPGNDSC
jgi:hypothetical protein